MATKWGIVSAGKICHDFVTAVQSIPGNEHEFVAVAARSLASATEFAQSHNISKAYGSYEELAKDPDVAVVYVGTVGSFHLAAGKLMLENGKHVLMEKPMTLNLKQTKELIETARKNKRFLMEALWSRFNPAYRCMMELIENGSIGDIIHVNVNFGVPLLHVKRLTAREVGGGTTLDLGIYTLNAVCMAYGGEKPEKVVSVGHLNENGVDISMCSSMLYTKNRTASITTNAITDLPCNLIITGTKGYIKIPEKFWCPTVVMTKDKKFEFPLPETIRPCNFDNSSGLRYEAMEVRECIKRGALESDIMPLKDSELLAEIMDDIRSQIGVVYPGE